MTVNEILQRLEGVTGRDGQYIARCPAHEDKRASLSVSSGADGRVLVKCQAGCTHKAVVAALGLSERDLFPAKPSSTSRREKPRIVATYAYRDAQGALLAEKLRYSDKHFSWRRPLPGGGWEYKKPPDIVPYNLPGLLNTEHLFLVEGEKDVDTLNALGFPAVCSPDGAGPGKWRDSFTEWLRDKYVYIIPDNDAIGQAYAQEEAAKISAVAKLVKMIDLRTVWPELPEHGDVTDLIQHMGASSACPQLNRLVVEMPAWAQGAHNAPDPQQSGFAPFEPFDAEDKTPLPPFPAEALPDVMRQYAEAITASLQVPVDMPAAALLAVASLAVQGVFSINPMRGWFEPLNLYVVLVAPPSEKKSPTLAEVTRCIYRFEEEENERRAPEIRAYQVKSRILSKQISSLTERAGKPKKGSSERAQAEALYEENAVIEKQRELDELEEVRPLRLLADDTTPEALTSLLAENNGRMGVMIAEGGLFSVMAGLYSGDRANIDMFLKAYTGETIRVDRKGRPSEYIPHPALTMLFMIQPQVLGEIMHNDEFKGRGLLARFLYCIPKSLVGRRVYRTPGIPAEIRSAWDIRINELLTMQADAMGTPGVIKFSPEAEKVDEQFFNQLEPRLVDDLEDVGEWAGKYRGQVMRIAGVLHCIENGADAGAELLRASTMKAAISIGEYFLAHSGAAQRRMGALESQETKEAKYILKRILSTGQSEISKRDLYDLCKGRLQTVEMFDPGLTELVRRGYVKIERSSTGQRGRPSEKVILNNTPEYQKSQ